ncbi:hypothetical protein HP499_10005 [Paenarthrobacter sp. CM16]|uniref:hypothetical protein n=1 Tax=Paenarthrobacter sp. CM16 TaxID=2738447 RepID=UPI001554A5C2|nr:hypothetical protein [Paenarthrobacter sp. CM16]NQD88137.1 hypothetical protein [Paenarthrobacter sp. CM16]
MQTMRRVLLLGALLVIPVLLAVAGTLLAAPSGPPAVDANPIELGPGPDGKPAPGLEPTQTPTQTPSPSPTPTPPAPTPPPVAPPPAPAPPAPSPEPVVPVPVVPPVVIDDDDDAGEVED